MSSRSAQRPTALALAVAIFIGMAATALVVYIERASAAPLAHREITGAGPLTNVYLGNELSCQLHHALDMHHGMYPNSIEPADCGTFAAVNGVLYAPDFFSHDGTAATSLGTWTPFTQVSQSAVTGSGTAADPFTVVTVADVGTTGLRITQTDSHVSGTDNYRTDIAIQNLGTLSRSVLVYRGARCFLADGSTSFGMADAATHAVGCSERANNTPPGRVLAWSPITPIDHHIEADFRAVWQAIGAQANLPDTCQCTTARSAAAAINWQRTLAPGASVTLSHLTTLSGAMPPPTTTPTATGTPTVTETHTPLPTETYTPSPTNTHTPLPTETHTATPTRTATSTRTTTATPTATHTATDTPTPTATHTATPTATHTHTPTQTATNTRTATATHTATPTWTHTASPTRTRTASPTNTHTAVPTSTPTRTRTASPSATYTNTPSEGEIGTKPTNTPRPAKPTKTAKPTRTPWGGTCADIDGNGTVTWSDVNAIVKQIGKRRFDPKYDLNGDGKITGKDVLIAVRQLGQRCERP